MEQSSDYCSLLHFLIDPREIHYLRFIVEAYPGIGVVSTLDSQLGLVRIAVSPGSEPFLGEILDAERENLKLREIDDDSDILRDFMESRPDSPSVKG